MRTRVLVVPGGVLEGTVARAITGPDVELVGVLSAFDELPAFVRRAHVDCVIAWLGSKSIPAQLGEARDINPKLRIVGIVDDKHTIRVYEIEPREHPESEFGIEMLTQLIQGRMPKRIRTEDGLEAGK